MQGASKARGGPVPFPSASVNNGIDDIDDSVDDKRGSHAASTSYFAAERRDWQIRANQLMAEQVAASDERDSLRREVANLTRALESQQARLAFQFDNSRQLRQTVAASGTALGKAEAENIKLREALKAETDKAKSLAIMRQFSAPATNSTDKSDRADKAQLNRLTENNRRLTENNRRLRERLNQAEADKAKAVQDSQLVEDNRQLRERLQKVEAGKEDELHEQIRELTLENRLLRKEVKQLQVLTDDAPTDSGAPADTLLTSPDTLLDIRTLAE